MECFAHAAQAAVGICKNCGRGVCRSCARDLGLSGIACSAACEAEVGELREINQRAKNLYGIGAVARKRLPLAPLMWASFALLFGGFGAYEYVRAGHVEWFLLLFGLLCAVLSALTWRRLRELKFNC